MVAMSDEKNNSSNEPSEVGVDPIDFEALGDSMVMGMGKPALITSKTGWNAIMLPMKSMPGEGIAETIGKIFSGGPIGFDMIRTSLGFLKLAVVESTETDGGARLEDLAFEEWMELLEQWANT